MRRLVHAGVLLSLGLGLAFAGLWVRSYWWCDQWTFGIAGEDLCFWSARGSFRYFHPPQGFPFAGWWAVMTAETLNDTSVDYSPTRLLFLFEFSWSGWSPHVTAPHWVFVLLFMIAPIAWLFRHRRRPKPGACAACGYDLRHPRK